MIRAILLTFSLATPLLAQERPSATMPAQHFALFENYCLDCHDAETEKGEVNLEALSFDLDTIANAELWQKVLNVMNSGEMPPEDKKHPPAKDKTLFLEDLSRELVDARAILSDSGGLITMRRLNRREYANTIHTLLGVDVDTANLPDDSNSDGFDTAGASLFFSSDQFETYVRIARKAFEAVLVPDSSPKPETRREHIEAEIEANKRITKVLRGYHMGGYRKYMMWKASGGRPPSDFGLVDEKEMDFRKLSWDRNAPRFIDYLTRPESKDGALLTIGNLNPQVGLVIPDEMAPGKYKVRAHIAALPGAPSERSFVEIGFRGERPDGAMDLIACRKVNGSLKKPETIEIEIQLSSPKNPLVEDIGSETKKVTMLGDRVIAFRERQPNVRGSNAYRSNQSRIETGFDIEPALWIDWVEWEGPFHEAWPTQSHRRLFFKGPGAVIDDAYIREILTRFARAAFRSKRPSKPFLDKLMALYQSRRDAGETPTTAIVEPLSVILASPNFLYLNEPAEPGRNRELTDLELAVRLSYFLWSAPPDAELHDLARNGKLSQPGVLKRQTNRMLEDPRAREFVSGFTHQWLTMERLDFFQFNHKKYLEFDESVKAAAREEVYQTLMHLLRGNLGIGNLLKSDFIVVNDLLADYYGIDGVDGPRFREVKVSENSPRGGLLGTAAVLAMGSDGERSSPVERGAWVMRKLLHDPPPPAPANVPQLSRLEDDLLGARELQQAHMEEPQCAQCHRKIDPIGYGLQNFDAAGRWRDIELVEDGRKKKSKTHPIDPTGTLPDGTAFSNYFELRDAIAEREDDFARGFTEALIAYGLGRPYGFTDYNLADSITTRAARQDNTIRSFIHGLVQSKKFRTK